MDSVMFILLTACGLALGLIHLCEARQIIMNEGDLIGTCTKTCDKIHTMYDKKGCKQISSCTLSTKGWNKGFVRCDYCRCECTVDEAEKDVTVEKKHLSITEPDLLGTCTKTCDKRGLVRTNFRGCQEVRDCRRASKGWTRGFVRCDHCTCICINRKYAKEYRLENIKYDFSEADLKELQGGKPTTVAETIITNADKISQVVARTVGFTISESKSVKMSSSTQVGLTITVGASAGVEGVGTLSTSVSSSITKGFSYSSGTVATEQKHDKIQVSIEVPPKSSQRATVVGNELEIDVPYTATLVTVHDDGSESKKRVTGILTDVHTSRIRVNYEEAKPL